MSLDELNNLIKDACSKGFITPEDHKNIVEIAHQSGVSDSNLKSMIQEHLERNKKENLEKSSGLVVNEEIKNPENESGFSISNHFGSEHLKKSNIIDSKNLFTEVQNLKTQGRMSLLQKGKLLGKWVVIKRVKPENRNNSIYKLLFNREFENAYFLDHPNIVKLLGKGDDESGEYYYMEFVDGQPLTKKISSQGINDGAFIKKISVEILQALSYIHKKQIVHRDLKPDNILITDIGDHAKIIDFGLAKSEGFDEYIEKTGTPKYAAPEQKNKSISIDGRADIYSFGLILNEMLTGQTDRIQATKVRNKNLCRIIEKSTQNEPSKRYKDCCEIIEEFRNIEIKHLSDIIERKRKRNRILQIAGIAVGLLVLMKVVLGWLAPGSLSLSN